MVHRLGFIAEQLLAAAAAAAAAVMMKTNVDLRCCGCSHCQAACAEVAAAATADAVTILSTQVCCCYRRYGILPAAERHLHPE